MVIPLLVNQDLTPVLAVSEAAYKQMPFSRIFQDQETFRREVFKIAMEKFWIVVLEHSKIP